MNDEVTQRIDWGADEMRRDKWAAGPWDDEPDRIYWRDDRTGLPCIIRRNHMGAWCGYVGIGPEHPWHGKGYDDVDVEVHGSLTYSRPCQTDMPANQAVCHVPAPGEAEDLWWFGFDCAHGFDVIPFMSTVDSYSMPNATYKDVAYVRAETSGLARQLAEVKR